MLAGPAYGRPMQLALTNEGGGVDQQLGGESNGGDRRKGKSALKRS
jgi:hypothetical protein